MEENNLSKDDLGTKLGSSMKVYPNLSQLFLKASKYLKNCCEWALEIIGSVPAIRGLEGMEVGTSKDVNHVCFIEMP